MSARHEMRELVRAAQRAGLQYIQRKGNHPRLVDPATHRFVVISATPSCPHAVDNARRDVRKYLGVSLS